MIRLLLLIILGISFNQAAAEPAPIRFVIPEFKPLTYSEDNRVDGVGVELVSDLLTQLDWPFTIVAVPNYGRALAEVKTNRADGFFLATENEERNQHAVLSSPLIINNWSWFYSKHVDMSDEAIISSNKIGTIINTNTHKWLLNNNFPVSFTTSNPDQLIDLLAKKRLDAVFLAEAVFFEAYVQHPDAPVFEQKIEVSKPMGIYVSKAYLEAHPQLMPLLNQAILKVQ